MNLSDIITRELDIVFRYGVNKGREQLMPTQEQVIAEAREQILKAVDARVDEYREPLSNQPGWEWMKARDVLKDKLPDIPSEEIVRRLRSGEDIWQDGESAFGADDDGGER